MTANRCACGYSGGKDGHLALISAIEKNLEVTALIYLVEGERSRQPRLNNDTHKLDIIEEHSRLMGIDLFTSTGKAPASDADEKRMLFTAVKNAREKHKFGALYWGCILPDKDYFFLKEICRDLKIKAVFPLLGKSIIEELPLLEKYAIRPLITGVLRDSVPAAWLGRYLDKDFIRYAYCKKKKSVLYGDDAQTLVTGSSLFGNRRISVLQHEIYYDRHSNMEFFDILKWRVSRCRQRAAGVPGRRPPGGAGQGLRVRRR